MITLNLDWREVLWWMQGGMAGSHLRWSVYEDMVNKVWPQCSEQERRNIWFIMRRDLGNYWRPAGWSGFDLATAHGEGEWKPLKGYTIDREDYDQVSAVMYSLDYRNGWVEVWLVEQGMTVLDLVLTYKWYDMIESGEKREEYRAITPYWRKRIQSGKRYTHVRFHRGYTAKSMVFRFDGLRIGNGNTQWGAPADRDVFIISLGERYK